MNELEKTALNEILRTVTYIAEKVDEQDLKIAFLEGAFKGINDRIQIMDSAKD